MSVHQLPEQIGEFAVYFNNLLARVDQAAGWCGVFWQRDPDGMRACLDGREVPPWDVVEALLQDLAADQGARVARIETARARALHAASLSVFDTRPGGRDVLGERLGVMLGEQRYAAERRLELGRLIGTAASPQEADEYRRDLAWAQDDHERATARCGELRARLAELERRADAMGTPSAGAGAGTGTGADGTGSEHVVPVQRRSAGDDDPLTGPLPRPAERTAHPTGAQGPVGRPDATTPPDDRPNGPPNGPPPGRPDRLSPPTAPHRTADRTAPVPRAASRTPRLPRPAPPPRLPSRPAPPQVPRNTRTGRARPARTVGRARPARTVRAPTASAPPPSPRPAGSRPPRGTPRAGRTPPRAPASRGHRVPCPGTTVSPPLRGPEAADRHRTGALPAGIPAIRPPAPAPR
ncbi:hypothetical protein ACIQXD_18955 [Streptomyces uncialis]|uniref:hypothetical protein n=1 Tax=Streptomyces uncialis TaxID=1048205 RepID=UPI0037FC6F94